ncbi:MAG: hypothetical protein P8N02_13395 [Actinomycetota bacterium]|nr:hypothetical protein [Actinomycetota bacterium]
MSDTDVASSEHLSPEIDTETRTFSVSILVSAVRCMLTYVILPFVLPFVGLSSSIGPAIGLVVGAVAIVANVWSVRRFWKVDHRLTWPVSVLSAGILVLLVVLVVNDIVDLLG